MIDFVTRSIAMIKVLSVAWALGLLAASGAQAQEAIPTAAGGADGGAPVTSSAPPGAPIVLSDEHRRDDRGPGPIGPCGGVPDANGKPDRNPHGEVYGGVGTHGYRQYGGVVCVPVGDKAAVTIAVDRTQFKGRGW
jgi:hypothetical protein